MARMARPIIARGCNAWLPAVLAALAIHLTTAGAAADELRYTTYHNDRFGTTIDYPPEIFPVRERAPVNDDGRAFDSADKKARFVTNGAWNTEDDAIEDLFATEQKFLVDDGVKVTYAKVGDDWFVVTGVKGDEIYYERFLLSYQNQIINKFHIEYAASKRALYDPIVSRMARSLRASDGYAQHL
jgi:hypothetical protein